jgi:hypothetical protein
VFEHVAAFEVVLLDPPLEFVLRFLVDVESDVAERAGGQFRAELGLVIVMGELEERQRAAVGQPEEAVALGPHLAEQLLLLAPGRDEREAEDVLVEMARRLEVFADIGGVVQAAGQLGGHRHSLPWRRRVPAAAIWT